MTTSQGNFDTFYASQSVMSANTPIQVSGRGIYRFNASPIQRVPLHAKTGQQAFGAPSDRKRYTQIEFHGKGTLYCRIFVDGVWIQDASVTLTENPSKDRKIGIATGTRGYTMDIEFSGDADVRAVEYTYKPMPNQS